MVNACSSQPQNSLAKFLQEVDHDLRYAQRWLALSIAATASQQITILVTVSGPLEKGIISKSKTLKIFMAKYLF